MLESGVVKLSCQERTVLPCEQAEDDEEVKALTLLCIRLGLHQGCGARVKVRGVSSWPLSGGRVLGVD